MEKVARPAAELEFNSWLDFKRVKESKRVENQQFGEQIINGISDGTITIDEATKQMTVKLDFPLTDDQGNETVNELVVKPRLTVQELNAKLGGTKGNAMDMQPAYIAAITSKPIGLIKKLDTQDYSLLINIVVYFL